MGKPARHQWIAITIAGVMAFCGLIPGGSVCAVFGEASLGPSAEGRSVEPLSADRKSPCCGGSLPVAPAAEEPPGCCSTQDQRAFTCCCTSQEQRPEAPADRPHPDPRIEIRSLQGFSWVQWFDDAPDASAAQAGISPVPPPSPSRRQVALCRWIT